MKRLTDIQNFGHIICQTYEICFCKELCMYIMIEAKGDMINKTV